MKIKILASMLAGALAMLPVTANAGWGGGGVGPYGDPITIYGWQNHTFEVTEYGAEGSELDKTMINGNAGNIGFLGFVDTGIEGLKMTWRCETFTYMNDYAGTGGWCNRNSKVGISGSYGEFMFANWLLPYNEMVAGWVDPWYDAGSASHTNIMGSVGAYTIFYNLGDFGSQTFTSYSAYGGIYNQGFNRRQEEILQYMGSSGKLSYRIAVTADFQQDKAEGRNSKKHDPMILSMGVAYSDGPFWGAVTYQKHDEWAVSTLDGDTMEDSEAESWRVAGRYIADMGNGATLTLAAMFENIRYEFGNTTEPGDALQDFGFNASVFDGGTADHDVTFDRDAWLVSAKFAPGGNVDFRLMYAEADDLDVSTHGLSTDNSAQTGADTMLFGIFYALGGATELNVSYIDVSNDDYGQYGTGISALGSGTLDNQVEIIQFGVLTMF
jgi:hypothetical protein